MKTSHCDEHRQFWHGGMRCQNFLALYFRIPRIEHISQGWRPLACMQAMDELVAMDGVPPNRGYGAISMALEEAFKRGLIGAALANDVVESQGLRDGLVGYSEGRLVGLFQLRAILEAVYRLGLSLGAEVEAAVAANREAWSLREKRSFLARLRRIVGRWMGRE